MSGNSYPSKQILILEDDKEVSNLLELHLTEMGYKVIKAANGRKGLEIVKKRIMDFIILDAILPGMNGLEICKEIRKMNNYVPIIILSARSDEIDKIIGLEIGADDYLTKPFSIRELLARVRAIFRRVEASNLKLEEPQILEYGELLIDKIKRKVMLRGERVELTQKEYDLLYLLAANPGRIYTRDDLLSIVWGYEYSGYEHTISSHINRLRNKIETDSSNPKYILTTWGLGYRFNDLIAYQKFSKQAS